MDEKYNAFFNLYALGNILGYHNGYWTMKIMKHYKYDHINEYVSDFISLGGINGINIKKWISSDSVFYIIATSKALLKYKNDKKERYLYLLKNELIRYDRILNSDCKKDIDRIEDRRTYKCVGIFNKHDDARNINLPYSANIEKYENYAATRTMVIGLKYNKKKEIENLIEYSYLSTIITHSSTIVFLSSTILSYFVSLAIQEISIEKWPTMLVKLLESDFIKKYIGDDNEKFYDYLLVLNMWKNYVDAKFDKKGKKMNLKSFNNLIFRMKFYYDTFLPNKLKNVSNDEIFKHHNILQLIIAYDSLIDCDGYFEKLLFYSIFVYIFPSYKSVIGSIACGLYGLVYGNGDVPTSLLEQIEGQKELNFLGTEFFKLFY